MAPGEWFRHGKWDAAIQADFEAHLQRARDKVQPLKIQAAVLADSNPEVALRLLDRYFDTGDTFFNADALGIQARARVRLGDLVGAMQSYEAGLAREAEFPQLRTNSFVEYPLLVAEHALSDRYDDALRVLSERRTDVSFPVQRFMWHAARALILAATGQRNDAGADARAALSAAEASASGFASNMSLGLVGDSFCKLLERLRSLSTEA
jgi:hypothetical protein